MDREERRFWAKVEMVPGGCWLWMAGQFSNGYGSFALGGKPRRNALAHRWAYEHIVGPIPEGLDLDHLCRNRACVNPAHLEPVTRSENLLRGEMSREQTHCKRGHSLEGDNLYFAPDGKRHCVECRRERSRQQRAAINADEGRRVDYLAQDAARARAARTRKRGGRPAQPNVDKTHCPQGHPLSGDNLYVTPGGARKCRVCVREANKRAYRKRKAR